MSLRVEVVGNVNSVSFVLSGLATPTSKVQPVAQRKHEVVCVVPLPDPSLQLRASVTDVEDGGRQSLSRTSAHQVPPPGTATAFSVHFLFPGREHEVRLVIGSTGYVLRVHTKPLEVQGWYDPRLMLPDDVGLGEWVMASPGDWMWFPCARLADCRAKLERAFELGLFALPSPRSSVVPVIHPENRYCIDLCDPEARPWGSCKKLRRHAKGLRLSISQDFPRALRLAAAYHSESTWLTNELMDVFADMQRDAGCGVRHRSFELWDHATGELVALVLGFGRGRVFHDYTMCTLKRDNRSCGNLLTKAVGHLLKECGFTLWYWGMKVAYMHEYDCRGGRYLDRREFWQRWAPEAAQQPACSLEDGLRSGKSLVCPHVPPTPQPGA